MIGAGVVLALQVMVQSTENISAKTVQTVPQVTETKPLIDYEEVDLLAHLIYAEANTLGERGMQYAGSVVLNRVSDESFPDSIRDVIMQGNQYACVTNGSIWDEPSDVAYEIAEELIVYGSVLPESCVYQAEFPQGSSTYLTIGNTYICTK